MRRDVADTAQSDPSAARAHAVQQEYGNTVVGAALGGERLEGLGHDVLADLALSWIGLGSDDSNEERLRRLEAAGWIERGDAVDADPLWAFPSLFEAPDEG